MIQYKCARYLSFTFNSYQRRFSFSFSSHRLYVLSIMGVSKRSMLVTVCILFVIINMLEIVTPAKFLDYSEPIVDVSSQCQLTHQTCKPPRSPNPIKRVTKIGGIEGIQRTSSLDNTVRMIDVKNDIDN